MKKIIINLSFLLSVGGIVTSCNNEAKQDIQNNHHKEHHHETHETKEEDHSSTGVKEEGLTLNNGEKWIANPETHQGMTQIKQILDESTPESLEDYHIIGSKSSEQTSYIIHNCTMDGEAHEQLHLVLHPILDNIEQLENAKTQEEAEKAHQSLSKNIHDYFEFFTIK